MKKLNAIQTKAVTAYSEYLTSGMTYGEAMREAAKSLGDTPCITFLEELAKVHATKYGCNYTWNTAGTAVFYTGEESTRESRHGAAFQSWRRNVMVWFTPEREAKPVKAMRLSADARAAAKAYLAQFDNVADAIKALKAVA
jgi:dGTP triphosphohydrolase